MKPSRPELGQVFGLSAGPARAGRLFQASGAAARESIILANFGAQMSGRFGGIVGAGWPASGTFELELELVLLCACQ